MVFREDKMGGDATQYLVHPTPAAKTVQLNHAIADTTLKYR